MGERPAISPPGLRQKFRAGRRGKVLCLRDGGVEMVGVIYGWSAGASWDALGVLMRLGVLINNFNPWP